MKKKSIANTNIDSQQEEMIQKALRTGGFLLPETPEEVAEFERKFGNTDILLPEALRVPDFLNTKADAAISKKPKIIAENLAMAARDGSHLPDDILKAMKEHRHKAKQEKKKK